MTSYATLLASMRALQPKLGAEGIKSLLRLPLSQSEMLAAHFGETVELLRRRVEVDARKMEAAIAHAAHLTRHEEIVAAETIRSPDKFWAGLPADYDGPFNWEFLNVVLRPTRGITLTDVDAHVEINGWFLEFETKEYDAGIEQGQMRAMAARSFSRHATRDEPDTHIVVLWGKDGDREEPVPVWLPDGERCRRDLRPAQPVRFWSHVVKGKMTPKQPCTPRDVAEFTALWARCANSNNPSAFDVLNRGLA